MATKKATTAAQSRPTYAELPAPQREFLDIHQGMQGTIARVIEHLPRDEAEELLESMFADFEVTRDDHSEAFRTLSAKLAAGYRAFAASKFAEVASHG